MIDNMYNIIYLKLNNDLDVELIDELEEMLDFDLYNKIAEYLENDVCEFTDDLSDEISKHL